MSLVEGNVEDLLEGFVQAEAVAKDLLADVEDEPQADLAGDCGRLHHLIEG